MPKERPGVNPELKKYQFKQKYNWSESCTERMQLRMPPSMKEAIKEGRIEDWQEVARQAISKRSASRCAEKLETLERKAELEKTG